jgi:hypothetical protein
VSGVKSLRSSPLVDESSRGDFRRHSPKHDTFNCSAVSIFLTLAQASEYESTVYNVGMQAKITRREWAAALSSSVVVARAQATPTSAQQTADELLDEARGEVGDSLAQLRKFKLPATAEPAFLFKP